MNWSYCVVEDKRSEGLGRMPLSAILINLSCSHVHTAGDQPCA